MGFIFSMFSRMSMSTQEKNVQALNRMADDLQRRLTHLQTEVDGLMDKINAAETVSMASRARYLMYVGRKDRSKASLERSKIKITRATQNQLTILVNEANEEINRVLKAQSLVQRQQMQSRTSGQCDIEDIMIQISKIQNKRKEINKKQRVAPEVIAAAEKSLIINKTEEAVAKKGERALLATLDEVMTQHSDADASEVDNADADIDAFIAQGECEELSQAVSKEARASVIDVQDSAHDDRIEFSITSSAPAAEDLDMI